uniref:Centromere protein L n=1 Tax=Arion vulgaris TaxID=1028688 RepID=A0A0B6Y0L1_9EUPU
MNDLLKSGHRSNKSLQMHTPYSSTPRTRCFPKTPLSRRLTASARAARHESDGEVHDYEGLVMKTWKVYSLSPLYKFQSTKTSLTKYARSLDFALSQDKLRDMYSENSGHEKSAFSIYEGLNFKDQDAKAIQIQVSVKNESGNGANTVFNALMICVDLDTSPVPEYLAKHFTYYPVILVSGNKSRTDIILTWLEQHFDCRSASVQFSNRDLRWFLATGSSQSVSRKSCPVVLQYSLSDVCDGISTVDCKFDAEFCKELWDRLNGGSSSRQMINESEVTQYVTALEEHLECTMHILFSKLSLSEVGTSMAYVSSQGKLKLFSNLGVFPALHMVCEIVKDGFQDIVYPLS